MHKFRILWVGKTEKGYAQAAVEHYMSRIRPFAEVDTVTIRPASHSGRRSEESIRLEGESILKRLAPAGHVIALDERGKEMPSRDFSGWLESLPSVTFVLGGAYGLDREVLQRADALLSLSRMTLPHQLARIVLLEQIYRAMSLQRGHGYHHE